MARMDYLKFVGTIAVVLILLYLLFTYGKGMGNINYGKENFGGQDIHPSQYDARPNSELANSLYMQGGGGGEGGCNYVPPAKQQCDNNYSFSAAPSCPTQYINQCDESAIYPQGDQNLSQSSCFPRSQLTPDDLLPSDECNVWSKSNPYGSGSLADRNFLQAGWATGISSVGSVMKNPNLQLRSEIPNPQASVSPWMQTSISPDLERKPLEVGESNSGSSY